MRLAPDGRVALASRESTGVRRIVTLRCPDGCLRTGNVAVMSKPCLMRRDLLGVAFGLGGLSLAECLALGSENSAAHLPPARSTILVWLAGGPSHLETFDPKPEAPDGVGGPLGAIATSVAGVSFCETLPRLAVQADRLSVIRTVHHLQGAHEPGQAYMISGHRFRPGHNFPSVGAVVGHQYQHRASRNGLPTYVALPDESVRGGGHLGTAWNPLSIPADPSRPDFRVIDLFPPESIDEGRAARRRALARLVRSRFSSLRTSPAAHAVARYTEQAWDIADSPRARAAFDLGLETEHTRDRYGRAVMGQRLLMARRLVEAEVPFVTVSAHEWDDHRNLVTRLGQKLPDVDRGLAALIEDLDLRGLLETTLVVVTGEFGRTPKFNENAGRDHWSNAFSVLLAGGGVKGGRVIGKTDAKAAEPIDRPVTPEELYFTLYHQLGIDVKRFLPSTSGREIPILRGGHLIRELVS